MINKKNLRQETRQVSIRNIFCFLLESSCNVELQAREFYRILYRSLLLTTTTNYWLLTFLSEIYPGIFNLMKENILPSEWNLTKYKVFIYYFLPPPSSLPCSLFFVLSVANLPSGSPAAPCLPVRGSDSLQGWGRDSSTIGKAIVAQS